MDMLAILKRTAVSNISCRVLPFEYFLKKCNKDNIIRMWRCLDKKFRENFLIDTGV